MKKILAIGTGLLFASASFASGAAPTCIPSGVEAQAISVEGIGSDVRTSEAIASEKAQNELNQLQTACQKEGKTFVSCNIDSYYTGGEPVFYYATATAQYACY